MRELRSLRERAGRFAEAYPKLAGRLRLTNETSDAPHVERLIQSVAFVAARIRQKLDDELPELTDGILETLYPHHLAPIPSMTLAQLVPGKGLQDVQTLPRHSEIETAGKTAEKLSDQYRFRTTRAVPVLPLDVGSAWLKGRPFDAPRAAASHEAAAALMVQFVPHSGSRGGKAFERYKCDRFGFAGATPHRVFPGRGYLTGPAPFRIRLQGAERVFRATRGVLGI